MPIYNPSNTAEQNLAILAENPYPGRLLVVGFAGEISVLAYAVEGRSPGSRNRDLVEEDNVVSTVPADVSQPVGDPELTIYDAMRRAGDFEVVSNGNQTDRVIRYIRSGKTFAEAMEATEHEPDEPNFTPRITGFHHFDSDEGEPYIGISVISKDPSGKGSIRRLYTDQSPELSKLEEDGGTGNIGFAVHTYLGDGSPLPSFNEPPFAIPVQETAEDKAAMIWENLDRENRVATVAKTIGPTGIVDFKIINASSLS